MSEFTDGLLDLAQSNDPEIVQRRVAFCEFLETCMKVNGLSRMEVGELCLDYFACSVCESNITSDEDFESKVQNLKTKILMDLI